MLRLIGIDGDKGVGKDTLAEVLIRQFGFTRIPFAKPLKDILSEVYLLPPETFEDRVLKEQPFANPLTLTTYHIQRVLDEIELRGIKVSDQAIQACLSMKDTPLTSPRTMMQIVGSEMVRVNVGFDTWVNLWVREQAKYEKVVAPDARFQNERDAISVRMGKNVLVKRPNLVTGDVHMSENNHGPDSSYDAIVNNTLSKQAIASEFGMWYVHVRG